MKSFIKHCSILLLIICLCVSLFAFVGCNQQKHTDDDYVLTLVGLEKNDIEVTKGQIRNLFKTKPVELDKVVSADKTDSKTLEKIEYSVKGVYLNDIIETFAKGYNCNDYGSIKMFAEDKVNTTLSKSSYDKSKGGTDIIIALEFNGKNLVKGGEEGALKAVLPNQPNAYWTKFLYKIEFFENASQSANPTKLTILENLDSLETLKQSQFDKEKKGVVSTYKGIKLQDLIKNKTINATSDDEMRVVAWDYNSGDGQTGKYQIYANTYTYELYSEAFLVFEKLENGKFEAIEDIPSFDGVQIGKGKIKGVSSLSVNNDALVCLHNALPRYDSNLNSTCLVKEVLKEAKMWNGKSFKLTDINGNSTIFSTKQAESLKFEKIQNEYFVNIDGNNVKILTIEVVANEETLDTQKVSLTVEMVQGDKTNTIIIPNNITNISYEYTSKGETKNYYGFKLKDILSCMGKIKKTGDWMNFIVDYDKVGFYCSDDLTETTDRKGQSTENRVFTKEEIESESTFIYLAMQDSADARVFSDIEKTDTYVTKTKNIQKIKVFGEDACTLTLTWTEK